MRFQPAIRKSDDCGVEENLFFLQSAVAGVKVVSLHVSLMWTLNHELYLCYLLMTEKSFESSAPIVSYLFLFYPVLRHV